MVLCAFSCLYCFLYCGKQNLSFAMPLMMAETGWTALELGVLTSVQFWTYAIGQLVTGRLGETIGLNKTIITGMALSAVMNMLIGFQGSLFIITILWGINGFVQSMVWPPGVALLANWWPTNRRGFALGVANASSGLGSVIPAFVVSLSLAVMPQAGWRGAFIGPAIIMIIVVIAYPFLAKERPAEAGLPEYKDPEPGQTAKESELKQIVEEKGKLYPYIHLLKQWKFDLWMIIIMCTSIARYGLLTWIPTYYVEVYGVDISKGILGAVVCPLGMAAGALIIPWLSDKIWSQKRLLWVIFSAAASVLAVVGFMNSGAGWQTSALLFAAGFFIYGINSLVWIFATDVGGRVFSGTATGILNCAAYIGASLQALYFGSILTKTGDWTMVFNCIIVVLIIMIAAAAAAGRKKGDEHDI